MTSLCYGNLPLKLRGGFGIGLNLMTNDDERGRG